MDEAIIAAIRSWSLVNVPEFAEFEIAAWGKYLGWYLGSAGNQNSWIEPMNQFREHIVEISRIQAPAALCVQKVNQRAVPVISYVAGFSPPPAESDLIFKERHGVHKMLFS